MSYPFWDVGLGYGLLMAGIAIVHVFISHFAIGGGLFLVVTEARARRRGDAGWLEYLERLSRFFALTTLVLGALTGVGIWFVIGLLNPAATELLIHNFVWGWATEWTFFVVEITAAIVYFYGWRRMSARSHLAVGWLYFAAAWLSLAVINGILTFMLTPGRWLATGSFWDGFFTPAYWPSLVMRTGVCILLAGVYALAVASRRPRSSETTAIVRYDTAWALGGLALAVPAFYWYFATLPAATTATARADDAVAHGVARGGRLAGGGAGRRARPLRPRPRPALRASRGPGADGPGVRLVWQLRAAARVDPQALDRHRRHVRQRHRGGPRAGAPGDGPAAGPRLPHRRRRARPLQPRLPELPHDRRLQGDAGLLRRHRRRLHRRHDPRRQQACAATCPPSPAPRPRSTRSPPTSRPGSTPGRSPRSTACPDRRSARSPYQVRCVKCHVVGGYDDKTPALAGMDQADIEALLDAAGDLTDEMPPFTGDATERAALAGYLLSVTPGGAR